MAKDYYSILGVGPEAKPEEIRRAYRKLAFELHPDRNGGSREAEEAFKKVTEAYAVVADPSRRAAYDASQRGFSSGPQTAFDPNDVFADLFRHPVLGALFSQLSRDFARQGLRFDEAYLRRVFTGHRGGVFFGGVIFAGPLGGLFSSLFRPPQVSRDRSPGRPEALPKKKSGRLASFLRTALPVSRHWEPRDGGEPNDVSYRLPVSPLVLSQGGKLRVSIPGRSGRETYDVRIPAGLEPGTRLRLAGRGGGTPGERGDLYLEILPGT